MFLGCESGSPASAGTPVFDIVLSLLKMHQCACPTVIVPDVCKVQEPPLLSRNHLPVGDVGIVTAIPVESIPATIDLCAVPPDVLVLSALS